MRTCVQGHSSHAEDFDAQSKNGIKAEGVDGMRAGVSGVLGCLQRVADPEVDVDSIGRQKAYVK